MSAPEVVGCSWMDDREFAGRGRTPITITADVNGYSNGLRAVANALVSMSLAADDASSRLKAMGMLLPPKRK
jgi:hypothetical protein